MGPGWLRFEGSGCGDGLARAEVDELNGIMVGKPCQLLSFVTRHEWGTKHRGRTFPRDPTRIGMKAYRAPAAHSDETLVRLEESGRHIAANRKRPPEPVSVDAVGADGLTSLMPY